MPLAVAAWDRREDLIYEGYALLDGSGNLEDLWAPDGMSAIPGPAITTPWHSSAGINSIRIATNYGSLTNPLSSFSIEEATYLNNVVGSQVTVRSQSIPITPGSSYVQLSLTGRMFRFHASGTANDFFVLTVRVV